MDTSRRSGPPVETVLAAQRGDAAALDELLYFSLPLVYNIVGRALAGHADTDDLVQETMLHIVRGVPQVRDPAAFRSWVIGVAIRQVRWYVADRARAPRTTALDRAPERADPQADFVDLCILRLGLTGQRREVAEATRWLDEADRELLALWWLEAAGNLERDELAAALELTSQHTAVRVQRMKQQLDVSRAVVRALNRVPVCPELGLLTGSWDRVPSSLWRKRFGRHVRECVICGTCTRDLVPVDGLLVGVGMVPVPLGRGMSSGLHSIAPYAAAEHPGPALTHSPAHSTSPSIPRPAPRKSPSRSAPRRAHGKALRHWHAVSAGKVVGIASAAIVVTGASAALAFAPRSHTAPPAARPLPIAPVATASPTPTPTPTPTPSTPAPTTSAPHPPVTVTSAKKGAATWSFSGETTALATSGVSWYYTWGTDHQGITAPAGVQFVPMIWGAGSVTASNLSEVKSESSVLLGFNEPDMSSQANMTPQQALALWPQLMATGMTLGSPAVASGAATPGGWLDQFMQGAHSAGYRVDFITVHWYGSDFSTPDAVNQLESYLQAIHARYGLPIWLTEYALISFSPTTTYPTAPQQTSFVAASSSMLQSLSYVQRYSWFAFPDTTPGQTGMFEPGGAPNSLGQAYEQAGN